MLTLTRRIFFFVSSIVLVFQISTSAASASEPDNNRIVVMMSIDGLAAFYLDDPKAEMPTIRMLASEGARAKMMKASTPTVTWPNHTTLVTGDNPARHGVVGNNYYNRETGKKVTLISDPVFDKDQIVKVPTIYDVAKDDGLKTAAVLWPATRNARSLDWTTPDVASEDLRKKYTTPALIEDMNHAGINIFEKPTEGSMDDTYTKAFNLILHEHRPNLALLHVAFVDHTQHLYGPRTPEAYAAIKAADGQVRMVWDELQKDFPGTATLIIVSDHGFSAIKRTILPNVILRKAGLESTAKDSGDWPVHVIVQGGALMVYVRDEAKRDEVLGKVRKAFAGIEGISKMVSADKFKAYGVANPKDDPHAPDLWLFADEGYAFGDTAAGSLPFSEKPERKGTHGHDSSLPDLHATFVAWGDGIKPGVKLGEISNIDVAPTIAKLLGIKFANVDGKPLRAILKK
jgi:predicted AlkP superfamily pyrophosphatase or phosphodiesterase